MPTKLAGLIEIVGLWNRARLRNKRATRKRQFAIDTVFNVLESYYGRSKKELLGRTRKQPISRIRQAAMYFIRRNTSMTLEDIGELFGRDHTTVVHAIRRVNQFLTHPDLEKELNELEKRIDIALETERRVAA